MFAMLRYLAVLVCFSFSVDSLQAQPVPRLNVLSPAGGQVGTEVKVVLTGTDLDEVTSLLIAPAGLTAERTPDPAKKGSFLPNAFTIKIPKETVPGTFDVRAVGSWGATNPRAFVVGELPEHAEKEPNNDVPQAQSIPLNSTVNGVIQSPADVDYYSVSCKANETVIVHVLAESMDSRLEPDVRVFQASGKLITANRPRSVPDGICTFTAPADGLYLIRICAHAHVEGNPESFYRLSVSTRPWIEAIYPGLVEPGKATSGTIWGYNLPGGTADPSFVVNGQPLQKLNVTLTPPADAHAAQQLQGQCWIPSFRSSLDGFFYRTRNAAGWSNSVHVTYAHAPVIVEAADHGTAAKAQPITLPCELAGRIERRNDRDWYAFTGKANEVISLDAFAERLGVPVDLYFALYRENGTLISEYDDQSDPVLYHRFYGRTDDPSVRVTLPADGKYHLLVSSRDATLRGDPRLMYRISLNKPRPDFRVVAADANPVNPGTIRLVPGGKQLADLVVFRRGGFTGPITIGVEGLPAGVTCESNSIPAGANTGLIVFSATDKAAVGNVNLVIKATASIDGQTVTREVRTGCLVWPNVNEQNNSPGISRLCRAMVLSVCAGKPAFRISSVEKELKLPAGAGHNLKVKVERLWPEAKTPIIITALHLPVGVTFNNNQPLTLAADKNDAEIRLQIQPNSQTKQFPLVLRAVSQVPFAKDPQAKQKPNIQIADWSSPCPVEVYRELVEVTVPSSPVSLKPEGEATVELKLKRLNNYQGAFTVQVQGLPGGITSVPLTIAEKAVEAKLVLKANRNATAAKTDNVRVRCSGTVNGVNLVTEIKLPIEVVKPQPPAKKK